LEEVQQAQEQHEDLGFPDDLVEDTPGVQTPTAAPEEEVPAVEIKAKPDDAPEPPPREDEPAPPPRGAWAVQVASFPNLEEAQNRVDALTQGGMAGYRIPALVNGQTWYRVRVGGFRTREEAETASSRLVTEFDVQKPMVVAAP
ncbi:MAG: SPOR domain-containing protein, partial [Myxococcota bacterium]|nr:SPOR domain-containing protein [Myxococcota bacterium]